MQQKTDTQPAKKRATFNLVTISFGNKPSGRLWFAD